jgi:hypothetical protein
MDLNLILTVEPDLARRVDLDALSNFVRRLSQASVPRRISDVPAGCWRLARGACAASVANGRPLDVQLALQDDKAQQSLANMRDPHPKALPPGKPPSNPDRMLLASLANRVIRHQGPRFGITSKKHKHSGMTRHV